MTKAAIIKLVKDNTHDIGLGYPYLDELAEAVKIIEVLAESNEKLAEALWSYHQTRLTPFGQVAAEALADHEARMKRLK